MLNDTPLLCTLSHCHRMSTQQRPKGPLGSSEVPAMVFQPTHASLEPEKSSPEAPKGDQS